MEQNNKQVWELKAFYWWGGNPKAIAAGKLMDDRLKKEYSKGGTTNVFFDAQQYSKYFDEEKIISLIGYKEFLKRNFMFRNHDSDRTDKEELFLKYLKEINYRS